MKHIAAVVVLLAGFFILDAGCGPPPVTVAEGTAMRQSCNYVPPVDGRCPPKLVYCYVAGAVWCIDPSEQEGCCEGIAVSRSP